MGHTSDRPGLIPCSMQRRCQHHHKYEYHKEFEHWNDDTKEGKDCPVSLPPLFSIITMLTIPRTIAGIMVIPNVKIPRIPSTNAAMANLLILGIGLGVVIEALESTELQELQN